MSGTWRFAWGRIAHRPGRAAILAAGLGIVLWIPIGARLVAARAERELRARAEATPLVAGERGDRFDLVLAALWFRGEEAGRVTLGDAQRLAAMLPEGEAVPILLGAEAGGAPVVAVDPRYAAQRGLRCEAGRPALRLGEAVLGASVARRLALAPGAALESDPDAPWELLRAGTTRLDVVGVLTATGGPDDEAVFTTLETGWLLEGRLHGHADAATALPDRAIVARTEGAVVVDPGLPTARAVATGERGSFHLHGETAAMPITAVLLFPADARSRTILRARINGERGTLRVLDPAEVVEELLATVLRLRGLLDALSALLALTTLLLTGLLVAGDLRAREREHLALRRLGAPRSFVGRATAAELGIVLAAAALVTGAATAATLLLAPRAIELAALLR